jgi:monothiol bacilliredoxin
LHRILRKAALDTARSLGYNQLMQGTAEGLSLFVCHPNPMLTQLCDLDALEAAIEESRERPVILFKHSRTCGISCEALDELRTHLEHVSSSASYKLITVQSHRHVSDVAERRLGVRHETPQAILLKDGKPVWKASHFKITADALFQALDS